MSSRSIYEFRSAAVPAQAAVFNRTSLAAVVSICDSPAYIETLESRSKSDADGLGCARGIRAAFLLEGGAALVLYGIWHFWHLIH
jgi:hypothetical protein